MSRSIALLLLGGVTATCGGGQPEPTLTVEESSLIGPEEPAPPPPEPACAGDRIARADLTAVLDAGPAPLLALVETRPRHRDGRFVGFEIVAFSDGEPPACPALRAGDVLVSVNGKRIERPEHYFEVFQELRGAAALELELIRGGRTTMLNYAIVDE
jgi:type II secretory pathway component PulC